MGRPGPELYSPCQAELVFLNSGLDWICVSPAHEHPLLWIQIADYLFISKFSILTSSMSCDRSSFSCLKCGLLSVPGIFLFFYFCFLFWIFWHQTKPFDAVYLKILCIEELMGFIHATLHFQIIYICLSWSSYIFSACLFHVIRLIEWLDFYL